MHGRAEAKSSQHCRPLQVNTPGNKSRDKRYPYQSRVQAQLTNRSSQLRELTPLKQTRSWRSHNECQSRREEAMALTIPRTPKAVEQATCSALQPEGLLLHHPSARFLPPQVPPQSAQSVEVPQHAHPNGGQSGRDTGSSATATNHLASFQQRICSSCYTPGIRA